MYESTPQHLIDEESHPGVLAEMLNASSSSDESTSSNDTDSDATSGSHTTAKRFKRALRRKRRKSSLSSKDPLSVPCAQHPSSPSIKIFVNETSGTSSPQELSLKPSHNFDAIISGDEADIDRKGKRKRQKSKGVTSRDFQTEQTDLTEENQNKERKDRRNSRKVEKSKTKTKAQDTRSGDPSCGKSIDQCNVRDKRPANASASSPWVHSTAEIQQVAEASSKRPFHFRHLSPNALPRSLSPAIFSLPSVSPASSTPGLLGLPKVNPNIRRTTSLPEMSHIAPSPIIAPVSAQPLPHLMPSNQQINVVDTKDAAGQIPLSRTSAILLLLVVTALVAVCAEFLVHSIDYLVQESGVSQAFIGLIILPMVGNAAEHVTAVTVASKNKMDLAIGVALGSSIQIAIFVTPLVVLLGWCLNREMSLYFSLFETISLFASAFIVNYLMIDGRSNYLEGALLIAAYIIIALAAFFYPSCENLSEASGLAESACR